MEEVVPAVPRRFFNQIDLLSPNLANYSFDQFAGMAAFDQIALVGEGNLTSG